MAQVPSLASPYGKECRACWTVPEGYKLVAADYSQIELRIMAHLAEDPAMIDAFQRGADIQRPVVYPLGVARKEQRSNKGSV